MKINLKKNLHALHLQIIDDFQESKATIVLLNLIMTDQIKFVKEFNQLNVTLM